MKILDVKGMPCPMPLIETKKALKELEEQEKLKILLDNPTSAKNVVHFLKDNNIVFNEQEQEGIIEISVNYSPADLDAVDETAYCSSGVENYDNYVVMFAKDRLGEGSEELGEALAGAMIHTLKAMEPLPRKIIFMNSGVNLVLKGSLVLKDLQDLEKAGVDLVSCGTCLDYFGKMEELAVGRMSNMLEILQSVKDAQKVINI